MKDKLSRPSRGPFMWTADPHHAMIGKFASRSSGHQGIFPLIATRPPAAPWVRPPLRSLRWMESFLDTLLAQGFSDAGGVAAYRAFSSFLLGHLLLEVSAMGVDTGPVPEASPAADLDGEAREATLEGYPHLQRLEPELSQDRSAQELTQSLANLLDRLKSL